MEREPVAIKEKKQKSTYKLKDFMRLINSVNPKKNLFLFGLFLSILTSGASLIVPQLTKGLIDTSQLSKIDGKLLGILALAFIVQLVFGAIGGFLLRYVGETVVKSLREKLWQHLLYLPVGYYDQNKSGETSSRLVNDTGVVKELVASHFPNFITGAIQLVGSLVILFFMDWKMASIMFLLVPIVALVILPIGRIMMKLGRQLQAATAKFSGEITEKVGEIRLIKASNGEDFEEKRGNSFIQDIYKISIKDARVEAILQPIMMTMMLGMFVGILGYGAIRVQAGTLTSGSLVAFLLYLFNIVAPVTTFATFFSQVQKAMGATERIDGIFQTPMEKIHEGTDHDVEGQTLIAENITFGYEEDRPVLKDISFRADPNTVIAFAGPSGGGKSTIFSILERFHKQTSGKISIDEIDLETIKIAD